MRVYVRAVLGTGLAVQALCLTLPLARADIYKYVDAQGRVTYSNTPIPGGKKVELEPLNTITLPKPQPLPGTGQEGNSRVQQLKAELAAEEKRLAEAQQALKEGEEKPEVYRGPGGKTFRNVAKYDEKIRVLKEQVALHEKNVEVLKRELAQVSGEPR